MTILPFILMLLCLSAPNARAACPLDRPVVFAGVNWESGEFITAVIREMLERGYACRTETVPGNSVTLEQATANDEIQIFAEEWVNRSDIWKSAQAAGKVQAIGHPFTGADEGWYIPAYMVNGDPAHHLAPAAPGLHDVSQLPGYASLFSDPEQPSRGRFLNCPSGWTCEGVNSAKLHAYGLDKAYINFRPGTGTALDAAITSAYLQRQNILFYYFSPSAIAGKFALVKLHEPAFDPAIWRDLTSAAGTHDHGCAAPPADIAYGVSSAFAREAPQIIAMLTKATIPIEEINRNLAIMADRKIDAPTQARLFLHEHGEIWHQWLPAGIAATIDESLEPQKEQAALFDADRAALFPQRLVISIRQPVNRAITRLVTHNGAAFHAASKPLLAIIVMVDALLRLIPWWLLIAIFAGLAWAGSRRVALSLTAAALMFCIGILGLWDLMLQTLTLMLIASLFAFVIGLPFGILAAKLRWARAIFPPVLDVMQTMPSFVYLIPALMLFGLGKVPAILATIIYALPPMIRLTTLGIDQVDPEIKEAASAFGVTPLQMLLQVELPLARPSIMAGINQMIMLALSMVVVASMIGARGLGEQVLNGIQTLDVGLGLEAGIGIVILAIVLDRITQSFSTTKNPREPHG